MKQYNGEKYIVSFTSFGPRIESACKMVFCLTKQKYKNFHLVMTLYKDDVKFIGPNMQALLDNGLLELIVADMDLGPHLKYFYAMKKYWDKPIITVDDDRYYSQNVIYNLVDKYEKTNYKAIISNCAIKMQKDNAGKLLPYPNWIKYRLKPSEKSNLAMAEGFAGILYPPCAFNNLDDEVPNILKCKYDDDLFLKTLHIKHKLTVIQVDGMEKYGECNNITEMMAYNLHNNQNRNNTNRINMCTLFAEQLLKAWEM